MLTKLRMLILVAQLFLTACPLPTAKLPSSDSKAPVLTWEVINTKTSERQNVIGSGTIQAKLGDSFNVLLHAANPGGISEIELVSNSSWTCENGSGIGQNVGPGLAVPRKQDFTPDANNNVPTNVSLTESVSLSFGCAQGFIFQSGSAALNGDATNFFTGKSTGSLVFQVKP